MDQGSRERFNLYSYGFKHISKSVDESIERVQRARDGITDGLPTKWPRLNRNLLGGLQKSKLYTIAGRPGSGKSAFSNQLIFDLLDCNADKKIIVLYWSFEMPSYQQILRSASKHTSKTLSDLLSVDQTLADTNFLAFTKAVANYRAYPVYFNDRPRTMAYIKEVNERVCESQPTYTVVNVFDHSRLIKGDNQARELERLIEVSQTCMEMQATMGTVNILLSQLNRNIEREDRAATQYQPLLSDLFGSDSLGQDSHVVMMINRPFDMYGITELYCGHNPKNLMAVHIEKNRDGMLGMIPFEAHMSTFSITERKESVITAN